MQERIFPEDDQVISLIRNGDAARFAEIVKRHESQITTYLYHLTGDSEASKDLAQDTFLSAYQGIMKNNADLWLRPWLYKIATNHARQYFRRGKKIRFLPFDDAKKVPALFEEVQNIENKLLIEDILLRIQPDQRTCMLLHFVEGFSYGEIAVILGGSAEAVRKRVARGSRLFQHLYKQEALP